MMKDWADDSFGFVNFDNSSILGHLFNEIF